MHRLRIESGPEMGKTFELGSRTFTIGRALDSDLVLPEDSPASRRHAEVFRAGTGWRVRDLGSTHGTFLNDEAVTEAPLAEGDLVLVGEWRLIFEYDGAAPDLAEEEPVAETAGAEAEGEANEAVEMPEAELPDATGMPGETEGADAAEGPGETPEPVAPAASPGDEIAPVPAPLSTRSLSTAPRRKEPVFNEAQVQRVVKRMSEQTLAIEQEIGKAIIGQKEIVRQLLTAIVSRGHVLMIGLPGLAKTTLIRTVSEVLRLQFRRIQFTPDLMPSDITGTDILEVDEATGRKAYRFIKGPIFTNILLADEINRTPPKTQAALLEAMQEYSVTAAGQTFDLAPPFFVLATQNPLEQEGTYPLPEAQLDRFMFSVYVDYPTEEEEELIAKVTTSQAVPQLHKILDGAQILELQSVVRNLPVSDHIVKYAVRLARATRPGDPRAPEFIKKWVHCGAGPRAVQYLVVAAKARAVIDGRLLVTADDVRAAARPVMRHRMFTNFTADSEGVDSDKIVQKLLEAVPEPGEKDY